MKTPNPQAFGHLVRDRRKRFGLSQDDIASVVGVNRRVVGELERGKGSVRLDIALRVAEAVGLDVHLEQRRP